MSEKLRNKAIIALGIIACLLIASLMVIPSVSADDETMIEGMVMDDAPMPIDAEVTLVNIHTGDTETQMTLNGAFEFMVEPGAYRVFAEANYYLDAGMGSSDVIVVKEGQKRSVDLNLKPVASNLPVMGYVLDDMGEPVGNAMVTAYAKDTGFDGYKVSAMTIGEGNDTGMFTLDLFNGVFDIYASANGYNYTQIINQNVNSSIGIFNITLNPEIMSTDYKIYGYARDEEDNRLDNVRAWAYDVNLDRWIEAQKSGGKYFEIKVYEGTFKLIVDVDGYYPYVNNSILINAAGGKEKAYVNAKLTKAQNEELETTLTLSEDFNGLTATTEWTITEESDIYGIDANDMGSLRMQIDNNLGDGNGQISSAEAASFKNWLQDVGPHNLYTDNLILVNGSRFVPMMNGNDPDYTIDELTGIEGPVDSTALIFAKTTMNYELETAVEGDYTFNVEIKDARENEMLTLVVDNKYEIIGTDNDMSYMKVVEETPLTLTVSKAIAPEADIQIVGDYLMDDNGVYIVDAGENITLKSVSTDQVGTIDNITWLPGDGISPLYTSEVTFKYTNDGMHTVRLKIKDSSGLEANVTQKFFVDTTAPIISYSIENATGVDITTDAKDGKAQEDEETQILFNATLTTDNKFGIEELTFVWNFGDGSGVVNGNKTTHTFTKPGKYDITLEARDPLGHNTTMKITGFTVRDTTNPWPVIDTEDNVDMGAQVEFNGTQSYDEDFDDPEMYERIVDWDWDFDYDDETFTSDAKGKLVNWQFTKPKTYKVMLRVTDVAGNVGETTRFVNVRGPDLAILIEPKLRPSKEFKEGEEIKFTVNITNQGFIPYENITVRVSHDGKVIDDVNIPLLKPNQKTNVTIKWKEAEKGEDIKLNFFVDPENAIAETNEENNQWNMTITVESDWTTIIVVVVIAVIIVVLVAAYFVWRKFFAESDIDEDRKDKRKKSGKKSKKDEDDDDDWDDDED